MNHDMFFLFFSFCCVFVCLFVCFVLFCFVLFVRGVFMLFGARSGRDAGSEAYKQLAFLTLGPRVLRAWVLIAAVSSSQPKANRPFDLLALPFWEPFLVEPKGEPLISGSFGQVSIGFRLV